MRDGFAELDDEPFVGFGAVIEGTGAVGEQQLCRGDAPRAGRPQRPQPRRQFADVGFGGDDTVTADRYGQRSRLVRLPGPGHDVLPVSRQVVPPPDTGDQLSAGREERGGPWRAACRQLPVQRLAEQDGEDLVCESSVSHASSLREPAAEQKWHY